MRRWRFVAWVVAASLVVQLAPDRLDLPVGVRAARADPGAPAPPPPAVDPVPYISLPAGSGPTEAPSLIDKDTVWGPQGSPYVIVRKMTIAAQASLTLLPGTIVKIDWHQYITVHGQILALGEPDRRVTITSLRDDSIGGDSNNDGAASAPARGDWDKIFFLGDTTADPSTRLPSVFDYTDIRFGGWFSSTSCDANGMIHVSNSFPSGARLFVANSRLTESATSGVKVIFESTRRGFVGIYNNSFASSCLGVAVNNAGPDVVGNTFESSLSARAVLALEPSGVRFWFNTTYASVRTVAISPPLTAAQFDARYNAILGGVEDGDALASWSQNWFGQDANVLPACLDAAAAAAYYPPLQTTTSTECPDGQVKVVGYTRAVLPALSASPQVLPEVLREAAAPRFGPVNTYTGALTYRVDDLAVEDAGTTVTATRTFRSDRVDGGDAGAGWTSAFSESLSASAGLATLSLSDGSSVGFVTDPAAGYTPAPGVAAAFSTGSSGSTVTTQGQTSYQFNPAGELTGIALGDDGHPLTVQRSDGRVSRVTGVSGRYLDYTRSEGKLTRLSDQSGRSVSLSHSGGRLVAATGVDGQTDSYSYDGAGRLTRVTSPAGRVRLAAGYRADGRIDWVEQQGTGRATVGYDDANAARTITLADGTVISQRYDWAGRLVTERVGGTGSHVVYDGEGRTVATVVGLPDVPMAGYGPVSSVTVYDVKGDPVLAVDGTGRYTATTFNARHQPVVTTRTDGTSIVRGYDGAGRMTTLTDPAGKVWRYSYNGRGQVTAQTDPLGRTTTVAYAANGDAASVTDQTGAATMFGYDGQGRRTSVTDPLGNVTGIGYTAWDQVRQVTRPRGGTTSTVFDEDRQPASLTGPAGTVTGYRYDPAGRLVSTIDDLGGQTRLEYDAVGRVTAVTDPRGSVYRQTYTAQGWVASATDPTGAVTSYRYDPAGRPYRITDPLGQVTQHRYDRASRAVDRWMPDGGHTGYEYDQLGRMSRLVTPRGFSWRTEYDPAGRPTRTTDPLTFTVLASYDAVGRVLSRTDQNGVVTSSTFDDAARTVTVADPLGTAATVVRDAAGRVVSERDGAGGQTGYSYDGDGNVVAVTDPAGGVWRWEYDLAGRLTAQVDPVGRRGTAGYDLLGRLERRSYPDGAVEVFGYDAVGNLTRRTDRAGQTWQFGYDAANRVSTATDPLANVTSYGYDAAGRRTSVTDPTGVVANTAYDPAGRPAVRSDATGASWVTGYDLDGNVSATRDPAGVQWTFSYNGRGELTRKRWGGTTDYDYTYDKAGRVLTAKEPYLSSYQYDLRGRVVAGTNGVGDRSSFGYDGAGRLTTSTRPSGHASTWTYDPAGRIRTAGDGLGNTARYDWDGAGQLATLTLPRGGRYRYSYDPAGRLASQTDPLDAVTGFGYDGQGRLTSTSYPSGRTVTAGYDAAGRQTTAAAGGQTRSFGYDGAGRLTSATAPGTAALSFGYNTLGQLVRSGDGFGETGYGYDAAARLVSVAPPAGPATSYSYNSWGLLAGVRGATNADFTGYDGAGQLQTRRAVAPSASGSEGRSYDAAGRLKSISSPGYVGSLGYHPDGQIATITGGGTTPTVTSHGYDGAGRLTSTVITQGTATLSAAGYGWDADGNRTSLTRDGQPAVTASYDLADRLTATSDGAGYGYDPDGLQTTAGPASYGYNGFGELTSAATGTGTIGYGRDPLGRIAARTADAGPAQLFGYAGRSGQLAAARTGTGPTTTLVRAPGGALLAEATVGAVAQQAWRNGHGDLVALKDDTGTTVRWRADYDPFGTVTSTSGTAPVPLGFQSQLTDPATGLVDMGFRPYDPGTGRFTAPDSIIGTLSAPVSLNRYLYANGDPVDLFDPDGHLPAFLDQALGLVQDAWNAATSAITEAWTELTSAVADTVEQATTALSQAWQQVTETASSAWTTVRRKAADQARRARTLAAEVSTRTATFWKEHGDQITATVASAVVGVAAFGVCSALTAGAGSVACMGLAGAAAGAVYGGMMCPQGVSAWACAGAGALAGGLAGLTAGAVTAAGGGLLAAGAASGLVGDAADQLLTTGTIDPVRLATATAAGGLLGLLGGKVPGLRGRAGSPRSSPPGGRPVDDIPTTARGRPSAESGCRHSFAPATPVLMADGTHKPIKDVTVGDTVVATDPAAGTTAARAVTRVHVNTDRELTDVTVRDADTGRATVLHTTAHHPFWDATDRRWVPAGQLVPGHRLLAHDAKRLEGDNTGAGVGGGGPGTDTVVVSVHTFPGSQTMHDLTVADTHTYHVVAGTTPVLVHNCGYANNQPENWPQESAAMQEAGFSPATAGMPEFDAVVDSGDPFLWAVGSDGTLAVGPQNFNGLRVTHSMLANGDRVLGAGMAQRPFVGGAIKLNAHSGHYYKDIPEWRSGGAVTGVGRSAFEGLGIPAALRELGLVR